MTFLIFSSAKVSFAKKKHIWKSYIAAKTLLTTKRVEFIHKKKFAKTKLDEESKIFVIYIAALKAPIVEIIIYSLQKA